MTPFFSSAVLLAVFGLAMWATRCDYSRALTPHFIVLTFALFAGMATVFLAQLPVRPRLPLAEKVLGTVLAFFYVLVMINPMLLIFASVRATWAMQGFLLLAGVGLLLCLAPRTRTVGAWLAGLALAEAHLLVVLVDPSPGIDIWVFYRQACQHVLAGENPYVQSYPDIYHGLYGYSPGLHYLPATLYCLVPFQWLCGEIRVGLWAAQVGSGLLLGVLARRLGLTPRLQGLAVLTWFMLPSTFIVIEESWMDTLLGFWSLAALVLALHGRTRWAVVCAALALCTKQTSLFLLFVAGVYFCFRPPIRREGLLRLGQAVALALALMLPFLLAAPGAYWNSVTEFLHEPIRLDAFSLISLGINRYELKIETWQTLLVYLAVLPVVTWRLSLSRGPRDLAGSAVLLLGVVFYFGKQAFLNYYDLLSLFLLAYLLMTLEADPQP